MTTASPGWLPDPTGRHEHRYWDGTGWTDQVADGGVASSDPLQQPAPIEGSGPHVAPPTMDMGAQGTAHHQVAGPAGGFGSDPRPGGQRTRSEPSTGLLVGLGLLVIVLFGAIVYVLMDDGGDATATGDSRNTEETVTSETTEPEETTTTADTVDDVAVEEDPLGISGTVDQMVADFGGEITEDDARCMIGEAARWVLDSGYSADEDFEDMAQEDQLAVTSAMLTCVDAEALVESLLADGMLAEGATQDQADCAAAAVVDAIGVDSILAATVANPVDPVSELPTEDQDAIIDAMVGCL